ISNVQVDLMLERYESTVEFDEISQTPKATITIREDDPITIIAGSKLAPGTYTVWFENEESIQKKLSLVGKYNIRGVGTWSIGQGNLDIFKSYASYLPKTVPITSVPYKETE